MAIQKKITYLLLAVLVFFGSFGLKGTATAAFLTRRSVLTRTPIAGAVTDYTISFTIPSAAALGSIKLEFCSDTPFINTACMVPVGFDISASTLVTQSGESGFTIAPGATPNKLILTRPAVGSLPGPVSYGLGNVTNPTTPNISTYLRISTYTSEDATPSASLTDQGAAVFSTAGRFGTTAYVPPHLYFCVGVTVADDCSAFAGDQLSFGDLKPIAAASATSQSAAATNDPAGYVIYSLGTTMTSGNNVIAASNNPGPSVAGTSQFGINLRDNNNPDRGQNPTGPGAGAPMPNYDTPDLYMFDPGAAIAQATGPTDYNTYTTTYITNVPLGQPAGVYATTITYLAMAQF